MKDQIRQLIADGRTDEALVLLAKIDKNAIALLGNYNQGKKQYGLGLIDFKEWGQIQAQTNYAALNMLDEPVQIPTQTGTGDGNKPAQTGSGGTGDGRVPPIIFISYNHGDAVVARKIRDVLEANKMDVIIDEDDNLAGGSIMQFIQESIKGCDVVLSIVSSKSLSSGWVGEESVASIYAMWLADKKFIPVRLDDVAFDIDFQIEAQKNLVGKLKTLEAKIKELRKYGGDPRASEDYRNRLTELKNNLGSILQHLNNVNMPDISGDNFEPNMKKVVDSIVKMTAKR
jgi:hypothetical protein